MAGQSSIVDTVLGPVPADDLGVVSIHESICSVYPGAQFASGVRIDRVENFEVVAARLRAFRAAGGGTVVDATGMDHGRDVSLLEALSRSTGVHLVASTGMGPEDLLGGYFLTPQTNPPTPWPADKFADLFAREITDGMVVPRVERRGPAGLVTVAVTRGGMTATDESLVRGAARAAHTTGVPMSLRTGADAERELGVALDEGLSADRVVVGDLDRRDRSAAAARIAAAGAYVALDHGGSTGSDHLDDDERAGLVADLVDAGHVERILLACSATGVAVGHPGSEATYDHLLTGLAPRLRARGVAEQAVATILGANPQRLLAARRKGQ